MTEIRVGKNARDNWRLIDEAEADDMWLHLDGGQSSAHVILRYPNARHIMTLDSYSEDDLSLCANILTRGAKYTDRFVATLVGNLRKTGHVGTVRIIDPEACLRFRVLSDCIVKSPKK